MKNQPKIVQSILEKAESSGRCFLLEPEVYRLLGAYGLAVPRHIFWPKGKPLAASSLKKLGTDRVVVKIVSPLILHKSDVGGVAIVRASLREVKATVNKMYAEIPARYSQVFGQGRVSAAEVADSIQGVLVAELVSYQQAGLGSELLLGLRVSRDFGPVITFGGGGLEVEFLNAHLREGHSLAILPPSGLNLSQTARELEAVAVFGKIARKFRGRQALVRPETLLQAIGIFQKLARDFSPFDRRLPFTLEELEVNPLVIRQGRLIPLDGLCRFSREKMEVNGRPVAQVQQLLEPKSLAIIGVSEKMNVGHIILNNVIQNGFPREKIYVIKPGLESIEGCRCFPSVAELPETVDLFILTLGAEMVYPVMKDLVELEKARSVIVIAGGLGEKSGTQSIEDDIRNLIKTRRLAGKPAPVVNGGNCLGIISAPGKYDSTFIPEYKFRKPSGLPAGLAIVSQSGAFMLSRMSKQDRFEPVYAISVGNQLDLTLGDYLTYLKDRPEVRIVAVYAEGFRPGDGWRFLQAARETVRAGKKLVVYKSGRSPEGRKATASHTASVAGDYAVGRSLLRQAGAIVAETIEEFEDLVKALILLQGKKIAGRRVGLMSNAGFESVIMADNLKGEDGELQLEQFSVATVARIMKILQPLGIDRLQDVHNPLDVTPMADDATFCGCVEALLQDRRIDCAVISCVPMTAALQTLPPGDRHRENIFSENSLAGRLVSIFRGTDKPLVVNIDAGRWYDPLAEHLEKAGLPVFRSCDQAVRFMRKLVSSGLKEL